MHKALFAGGADTAHMPTTELAAEDFDEEGNIDLISLLVKSALVTTRSEGRRAIEQGGVSVDGEKVTGYQTCTFQRRLSQVTALS